ncbi:MAG TPA: M28 family peptidase [Anaerolineaceae bacterium]|nr:M28 family peptidase [Anaerolineaceae bacterium]
MKDPLSAQALMTHVKVIADEIGPRPTGGMAEGAAHEYIRRTLELSGFKQTETMPFMAWNTWTYPLGAPLVFSMLGNLLRYLGGCGYLLGGALGLTSASLMVESTRSNTRQLGALFPKRIAANVIARVPASGTQRHKLVFIGHTDTNKERPSFSERRKKMLRATASLSIGVVALNALAQWAQLFGLRKARGLQNLSLLGMIAAAITLLHDDQEGYIPGANDNASAVACLIGLGQYLQQNPLEHTEVWLAFTAAEEVGGLGTEKLLDDYGAYLDDAWFIDFEMVGTPRLAYVTEHRSLSYLANYKPDAESLALAQETAMLHPEFQVSGQPVVITEEVGVLRRRGYRGLCLAGLGEDGWLANWHRYTDDSAHIDPSGLERAARFGLAMAQTLDRQIKPTSL